MVSLLRILDYNGKDWGPSMPEKKKVALLRLNFFEVADFSFEY